MTKLELVKAYLEADPELRERKLNLITKIWSDECERDGITTLNEFFNGLKNRTISNPETLRRNDMIMKNLHPHLLGSEASLKRDKKQQGRIESLIKDIKDIKNNG